MDPVGLCHSEGLILLVSFAQPLVGHVNVNMVQVMRLAQRGPVIPWVVVACEGSWSEKDTCLPFLSVVGWMFILIKSCISSMHKFIRFICSINCEIAPRIGSDVGAVWCGACV